MSAPFHSPYPQPSEPLRQAVLRLLERIPAIWQTFTLDELTKTESIALEAMIGAGLIERCLRLRLIFMNDPRFMDATIVATGECGMPEALERVLAAVWQEWEVPYGEWLKGPSGYIHPIRVESYPPDEWRLTDQGEVALGDAHADKSNVVTDYVLREGPFTRRNPCRGSGRLVTMKWTLESAQPVSDPVAKDVNIKNWEEGAAAFAKLFESLIAAKTPAPHTPVAEAARQPPETSVPYAGPHDPVPPEYCGEAGPIGPIQGNQSELAWAVDAQPGRKPRDRYLKRLHGRRVWVQNFSKKSVRVFFRSHKEFHDAAARLQAIRANPEIWRAP